MRSLNLWKTLIMNWCIAPHALHNFTGILEVCETDKNLIVFFHHSNSSIIVYVACSTRKKFILVLNLFKWRS